jgi:hypothetical protein
MAEDRDPTTYTAQELRAIRNLAAAKKGKMDPEETMAAADAEASGENYRKGGVVHHNSRSKFGAYHGKDQAFRKEYAEGGPVNPFSGKSWNPMNNLFDNTVGKAMESATKKAAPPPDQGPTQQHGGPYKGSDASDSEGPSDQTADAGGGGDDGEA